VRTIWAIYRADLRRAHRSLIALVVIFGLVVIPSLFTWFNVAASWDPFGNTRSLRIAIANTDAGYKSDLVPLHINIGDQVVSALRKNDKFDWVIASEEAAVEGTRSGDYYAAIVIPEDFSKDMLTFFDGEVSSAPMTYYVNEKKNGISPKLAGQGAEFVSAQVNQTFAQTLAEVALDTASSMGDALSSTTATGAVTTLDNRVQSVATRPRTAAHRAAAGCLLALDARSNRRSGLGFGRGGHETLARNQLSRQKHVMLVREAPHDRVGQQHEGSLGQLGTFYRVGAQRRSRVLAHLKVVDGDDGDLIGHADRSRR